MKLVADIDRERSLDAMWCAYLISNSVAENLAKNRTSVVRAFLNARYYNSAQGQFLSEEPVFLGDPKSQVLTDPQSLNSYSYANDNPIVKSDPSGKWWEVSGSIIIPGRSFSTGLRFDQNGIDYFMSGGFGYGVGGGLELAWAPGQSLSHQRQGSIGINAEGADVIGGRVSQNIMTYSPDNKKIIPNGDPTGAIVLGAGGGVGVQEELSTPIPGLVWGGPTVGGSRTQSTGNTQIYSGKPSVSVSQGFQSSSSFRYAQSTPSTLPSSVAQNGISYVRNSSGLLNFAK
jgi:RHS repeat-associated protein